MIDEHVKLMVRKLEEGDLTALPPLLDRLEELGDERRGDLFAAAGALVCASQADFSPRQKSRVSSEELAYRRDERNFTAWGRFAEGLRLHFWAELAGDSMAQIVQAAAVAIDPRKHAERLGRMGEGDDEGEETGQQQSIHNMPGSYGRVTARLKGW